MKIALIGDSTVTDDSGWGRAFAERFHDDVDVLNFARNGRSSKSWYDENNLPAVLNAQPDYVFIQFGHNDQPGKGLERETDPDTTYRDYLKLYIKAFRQIEAKPILVSSVARRNFDANGKIASTLTPWAEAAQAVAHEMNVPFIDLHALSVDYHNQIGVAASMSFNQQEGDSTHLNQKGAEAIADLIICELKIVMVSDNLTQSIKEIDMTTIHNPILKGFNPDPSILRIGEDYYIATSTFEWFPGVQIHHSRDLVNWRLLTRPLDRVSQLDMIGQHASCGIWAPNLTWDDGTFYLVYTNVKSDDGKFKDTHNYVVTAPTIEGPWSEPTYLHSHGFDPSLYHEDGRHWLLCMELDYRKGRNRFAGILLQEYLPAEHRLTGSVTKIFTGTDLGFTEGPNLYKQDGWYYLILAEGGTFLGHAVTVARSRSMTGPFEADPAGPVLTSRDHPHDPLQKAGHASIVEVPERGWYMAYLCGRPITRKGRCTLGRETALQQVTWTDDGWLRVMPVPGRTAVEVNAPDLPAHPWPERPIREEFDTLQLPLDFQTLRIPLDADSLSLAERPGFLRLKGRESVGSRHVQALVARRQQAFRYRAATCLEFDPTYYKHSAGLICLYDQENLFYLKVGFEEGIGRMVEIMVRINGSLDFPLSAPVPIPDAERWVLSVAVDYDRLQFSHGPEGGPLTQIDDVFDASILSDEQCREGRFTGAFVGVCCQDLTGGRRHADFDWFEYEELD